MLLALLAVAATAAGAQAEPPCSPAAPVPALVVTDPAGGGALFATHLLRVRARSPGGDSDFVSSLSVAPPARYRAGTGTLFSDTPGPLPVSAVVGSEEPTGAAAPSPSRPRCRCSPRGRGRWARCSPRPAASAAAPPGRSNSPFA